MSSRHTNTIKLMWTKEGYKPQGYDWKNYRPSVSSFVIRHDLMNHQTGESGTWLEEFRALGAFMRFVSEENRASFLTPYIKTFRAMLKTLETYEVETPKNTLPVFKYFVYYQLNVSNPVFWLKVLTDGYNHGEKFTVKAYKRMLLNCYEDYHKAGKNVTIDLDTGEVCKLTNSSESLRSIKT